MKSRLLIIIGIVVVGVFMILSFSNEQQNTCEQIEGKWNIDHCIITQETFDSNKLTCDPGTVLEDRTCQSNGIKLVFEFESPFLIEFPQIRQNDMYCRTLWYFENSTLNEENMILSIQNTVAEFGAHVDIPERKITVFHNEEETVISIVGVWTKDQNQHEELTSVIKNHMEGSKIIRDDIIICE